MLKKIILAIFLIGPAFLSCGCSFPYLPYLVRSGIGQTHVMTNAVPLDRALKNPNLSPEDRDKLLWVRQVREYAQNRVGLKPGKSYLSFYDTQGKPAVYNLSASRKDSLTPYSWSFPIVGKFDYLGYFDKEMAQQHAALLEKQGYDIVIYGSIAYSTAGFFADPLFSSLLVLDKPFLADTVFHELAHNTFFMKNDSEFTESAANFVGKKGAREFLKFVAGEKSDLYKQAVDETEDRIILNEFYDRLYRDLNAFYRRTDLSSKEKIARRNQIFLAHTQKFKTDYLPRFHNPKAMKACGNIPVNNACILLNRRYNYRTDLFEKVFLASRQDLKQTVGIFVQATRSDNAWQYLQHWLSSQPKS
jgi:predicted aminopeptidase